MARFWTTSGRSDEGERSTTLATSVDASGTNKNDSSNAQQNPSWFSWRSDNAHSAVAVPVNETNDASQQSWFSWGRAAPPSTPSNLPPISANSSNVSQPWYSFSWSGSTVDQPPQSNSTKTRSWYSFSWGGSGQQPQVAEPRNEQKESSWFSSYDSSNSLASMVSSLYKYGGADDVSYGGVGNRRMSGSDSSNSPPWGDESNSLIMTLQHKQTRRRERKRRRGYVNRSSPFDLSIFQNPYQTVRGLQPHQTNSHLAIRNFISLVPEVQPGAGEETDDDSFQPQYASMAPVPEDGMGEIETTGLPLEDLGATEQGGFGVMNTDTKIEERGITPHQTPPRLEDSWPERYRLDGASRDSSAETAAFLAEGTIRAWRDLCLQEALELNAALRFWSVRWERPLLSWLESGPEVWTSEKGYNHFRVGKRVAQIQAVLARRCAIIGELQQHLLRAGWQKGVAQWGVLGHGGHWATVAGFDGSIKPEDEGIAYGPRSIRSVRSIEHEEEDETEVGTSIVEPTVNRNSPSSSPLLREMSDRRLRISQIISGEESAVETTLDGEAVQPSDSRVGARPHSKDAERRTDGAAVFVRKRDGGGTFVDDPAYLGKWSVDAITLVRQQLFRASNGSVELPYASNWETEDTGEINDEEEGGNVIVPPAESKSTLPLWAIDGGKYWQDNMSGGGGASIEGADANTKESTTQPHVMITDVTLMTEEVDELLDVMEQIMEIQRRRRLDRFRAPSWLRRNWYVVATSVPLTVWLIRHGRLRYLINSIVRSVKFFFQERIQGPMFAIFEEIWAGRVSFSDKKARMETMEVLKKMIKSFLDETYPSMAEEARQKMADAMDVSLVESKKEESMKTFFEISNVVRMSFIEMQWLKKEMMNALDAMDEVMSANDINMNIAAITPVAMIVYGLSRITKYFVYGLFRLGRSREETYAQFRATLLDVERLLVMRDNPPDARTMACETATPCVLGSDDLGMLMLLIHECRTILWRDRRRFAPNLIRGVSEDLAELAGERGAVSVKQQLLIIARMARSYPFLKVISTGHFLGNNELKLSE